jgi:hypothetical protein
VRRLPSFITVPVRVLLAERRTRDELNAPGFQFGHFYLLSLGWRDVGKLPPDREMSRAV